MLTAEKRREIDTFKMKRFGHLASGGISADGQRIMGPREVAIRDWADSRLERIDNLMDAGAERFLTVEEIGELEELRGFEDSGENDFLVNTIVACIRDQRKRAAEHGTRIKLLCADGTERQLLKSEIKELTELRDKSAAAGWDNQTAAATKILNAQIRETRDLPETVRDFEAFLRDAGFSRSQSKAIASHGFKEE